MKYVTDCLFNYAVEIRRSIHRHPEIGFNLDKTVQLVSDELDSLNIEHTSKYGKGSVVAFIGHDPARRTLAFRADMDALPLQEKSGVPFSSEADGTMHACGHDAHTACLLAAARFLKENEKSLHCNLRLIFQPSEEGEVSGAKMLVDNGVMDGVDAIIAQHNENTYPTGHIAVSAGNCQAACIPATLRFYGKTAHATIAHTGVDAIAMGIEAYHLLKEMVKKEAGDRRYVWSVGTFHAGTAHNVVSDYSEQRISFRYYDQMFADCVRERANEICRDIADRFGGRYELDFMPSALPVVNDPEIAAYIRSVCESSLPVDVCESKMSSEDFCWYLTKAPGVFYRFGTKNEALHPVTRPHNNDYFIDEEGMRAAIEAFISIALNFR